ncbi:MAG: hypothetical protein AB2404_01640 [Planifilum fimeticola]
MKVLWQSGIDRMVLYAGVFAQPAVAFAESKKLRFSIHRFFMLLGSFGQH